MAKEKKPLHKRTWFIVLMVFIVLGMISAALTDDNEPDEPNDTPNNTSDNTPIDDVKDDEVEIVGIGDTLHVGKVSYLVHDVSTSKTVGGQYLSKEAQGTYLIVHMSIRNNSNEEISIASSYFKLINGEKTYESDSAASNRHAVNVDSESLLFTGINPDITFTGYIVFDVPEEIANSNDTFIQVQTGFWGTQTGNISLAR